VAVARFGFIYSTVSYRIVWGYLSGTEEVFYIIKKSIREMASTKRKVCCRELFRKLSILPFVIKFKL
jgi:hypothetical protein